MSRKAQDGRLLEVSGIDPEIVRDGGVKSSVPGGGQTSGAAGPHVPGNSGAGGAGGPAVGPSVGQGYGYSYGAGPNGVVGGPQQVSQQAGGHYVHHHSNGAGVSAVPDEGSVKVNNDRASGTRNSQGANDNGPGVSSRMGKRRVRLGWTEEETRHLMEGCKRHGVGNWKKILTDPSFVFNCRTAVDLKDRFRTSFPEEYSRLYPNARTHKVKRSNGSIDRPSLIKVNRKERRAFTPEEDEQLLQGFLKHGPAWSKIQRDQSLNLGERRSTDLRDRFRNAFPERYTAAGYKGRAKGNGGGPGVEANGGLGPVGQMSQGHTAASAAQLQAAAAAAAVAQGHHPGAQGPHSGLSHGDLGVNQGGLGGQGMGGMDDDVHLHQQSMMPGNPAAAATRGYMPMQHPLQFQQMSQMGYQQPVYFTQMSGQMGGQMGSQMGGQLSGQLGNQMGGQLGGQMGGQMGGQIGGQMGGQMGNQMGQLGGQMGGQLRGNNMGSGQPAGGNQQGLGANQMNVQQLPPHLQQAAMNNPHMNLGNMPANMNQLGQLGHMGQQLSQQLNQQLGIFRQGPQNPQ